MEPKIKRWTATRKAEVVLALLRGSKHSVDICREAARKQSEVEQWKEDFLSVGELALKSKPEPDAERELKDLRAKVGELLLEIVGWRLSANGIAKNAAATLEDALLCRKEEITKGSLTLRSDNGFILELSRLYWLTKSTISNRITSHRRLPSKTE